jgi:hypothetical protein
MKPIAASLRLALCTLLFLSAHAQAQTDPLPSWNDGPAKKAIIEFVQATTDKASPKFVLPRSAYRHVRSGRHAVGRAAPLWSRRSARSPMP